MPALIKTSARWTDIAIRLKLGVVSSTVDRSFGMADCVKLVREQLNYPLDRKPRSEKGDWASQPLQILKGTKRRNSSEFARFGVRSVDINTVFRFALYVVVSYLAVRWLFTLMTVWLRTYHPPREGHPTQRASHSQAPGSRAGQNPSSA
ncbi:MAG: hypothetical protein NZ899_09430 [Thermoguttaceae bacterium]|nr:hypothetical protein [Thermoguttaceae bacterium]MDW8079327.1 hypothetical protein [Thermoguttaceae bacterium]